MVRHSLLAVVDQILPFLPVARTSELDRSRRRSVMKRPESKRPTSRHIRPFVACFIDGATPFGLPRGSSGSQ